MLDLLRELLPERRGPGALFDLVSILLAPLALLSICKEVRPSILIRPLVEGAGIQYLADASQAFTAWADSLGGPEKIGAAASMVTVIALIITVWKLENTRSPFTAWIALTVASEFESGRVTFFVGVVTLLVIAATELSVALFKAFRMSDWVNVFNRSGFRSLKAIVILALVPCWAILAVVVFLFGRSTGERISTKIPSSDLQSVS